MPRATPTQGLVNSLRYLLVFPFRFAEPYGEGEGQGQPVIPLGITGENPALPLFPQRGGTLRTTSSYAVTAECKDLA